MHIVLELGVQKHELKKVILSNDGLFVESKISARAWGDIDESFRGVFSFFWTIFDKLPCSQKFLVLELLRAFNCFCVSNPKACQTFLPTHTTVLNDVILREKFILNAADKNQNFWQIFNFERSRIPSNFDASELEGHRLLWHDLA